METTVAPEDGNKVRLHVTVPADEFEKAIEAAFRSIAKDLRIPGFRPGKAPRKIIEARIGPNAAREQALRDALPDYYARAVVSQGVDAIAGPTIDITAGEESGNVEFDAVVEVRPVVTLEGYRGLRITLDDPSVSDEEIDAQVDQLRERFADLEDSAHPLTVGDYAAIDVKGYVHDEAVEGLSATDFLYEVGSGMVVAKLDAELTGKRPGDILKFNDTLGDQWGERAGDEVSFQVLVKETKRKVLPEASDEWVKEAGEFDTLAELRAEIRKRSELLGKARAQMELRAKVMESLAGLVDIGAPEPLVQSEMERRLHDLVHRLESQGLTIGQYLQATGRDQETFIAEVRGGATTAVRADLALRAVTSQEGILADDEEVDSEIQRFAASAELDLAEARHRIEHGGGLEAIRSELARGKALQFVVDHAEVVDEAGSPLDIALPEPDPVAVATAESEPELQPETEPEPQTGEGEQ